MMRCTRLFAVLIVCVGVLVFWSTGSGEALAQQSSVEKDKSASEQAPTGSAICTRCHDQDDPYAVLAIAKTRHGVKADRRTPTCQGCHGESDDHVKKNPGEGKKRAAPDVSFGPSNRSPVPRQGEACLACHRGGKVLHWSGSPHESRDVACANCHQIHTGRDPVLTKATQPEVCFTCHKTQRADIHKTSHHPLKEGKMGCSDCHNPHGSPAPTMLVKNTVTETCFTCHAEKRGPFLWEHPAVNEDCTNCHTPHGSNNKTLLKARPPFLCQSCHATNNHAGTAFSGRQLAPALGGTTPPGPSGFLLGKSCLDCHSQIHGSNHPSGVKFQR